MTGRERRFGEGRGKTLPTKILHVHSKTFYLKVIEEKHWGFSLKITELFCDKWSSQIDLNLSVAKDLRARLSDLVEFYASLLSVSRIPAKTDTILKSVRMRRDGEKRRYSLNFMENCKGRLL